MTGVNPMDGTSIIDALILGIIEGLTEFIPVSSTAHLLLAGRALGFENPGKMFEVLIQLGAILAILVVYAGRLIQLVRTLPSDPKSRRFVAAVFLAFLPAAVLGVLFHRIIKEVFFESPGLISTMLIVGGVVLLIVDRIKFEPRYHDVMDFPLWLALRIGFFQCLALVPGVSRSGATIVGSLLMGTDKRSAAEFSFYLAMPTMAGRLRLRPLPEPGAGHRRRDRPGGDRLRRRLRRRDPGGALAARLRQPARLLAVRLVADRGRRCSGSTSSSIAPATPERRCRPVSQAGRFSYSPWARKRER